MSRKPLWIGKPIDSKIDLQHLLNQAEQNPILTLKPTRKKNEIESCTGVITIGDVEYNESLEQRIHKKERDFQNMKKLNNEVLNKLSQKERSTKRLEIEQVQKEEENRKLAKELMKKEEKTEDLCMKLLQKEEEMKWEIKNMKEEMKREIKKKDDQMTDLREEVNKLKISSLKLSCGNMLAELVYLCGGNEHEVAKYVKRIKQGHQDSVEEEMLMHLNAEEIVDFYHEVYRLRCAVAHEVDSDGNIRSLASAAAKYEIYPPRVLELVIKMADAIYNFDKRKST
eukprot:gb/GECH01001340.1/.p1 GENE.gb/GECH01001340.1/~~gb/GECH01001340.1/.p1  ORF type:complete len:283 (+),score=42.39 gb/GECH01001340.1/:1-849(+)